MRLDRLAAVARRPEPFQPSEAPFWDDPWISARLLEAHFDDSTQAASRPAASIRAAVDRLVRDGVVAPGTRVLDLGCGPGRYAEALARHGAVVTGVDLSERSIGVARRRAAEAGLSIEYRRQDFTTLDDEAGFDVVMQVYGEVNTFSDDVRDALLAAARRALVPGGLLLLDLSTPALRRGEGGPNRWSVEQDGLWRPGTCLVLTDGYGYEGDVWCDQYVVVAPADGTPDGPGEVTVYRMWFHDYVPETITPVLARAGFAVEQTWEGLDGGAYRGGDWLGVLARAV